MEKFEIKLGLELSSEKLAERGANHAAMCQGLAWLTLPAGFLTGLETASRDLQNLDEEVLFNGGKLKFEAKRLAEDKVVTIIKELAGYVTAQCNGELRRILETGFEARSKGTPVLDLERPQNLTTLFTGVAGQVALRWSTVPNAIQYLVFVNTVDPTNEAEWKMVAYTSRARYTVDGLPEAKYAWFRVQAQGRKGLQSVPSQPASGLAA